MSGNIMEFPDTVEEFMESYKMVDRDHVYSNGTEYVPIFRMKQWFDHVEAQSMRWIPCSERLPEDGVPVLVYDNEYYAVWSFNHRKGESPWEDEYGYYHDYEDIVAWMPLPEPYEGEKNE